MKKKAIIFDLDGTLFDSSERFMKCSQESKTKTEFWQCFQSDKYMHLDRPIMRMIELARKYHESGYAIIIITGRAEDKQKDATLRQLRENDVPFDEIYFRKPKDFRKDYEFKSEIVASLLDKYEIEAIYDDSADVRDAISKKFGISAFSP